MTLKITAKPGLLAGQFRDPPIHVREGVWSDVDPTDSAVRKVLLERVPSHVRIAPGQEPVLAAVGLALAGGHLREIEKPAEVEKPTPKASSPPTPPPASTPKDKRAEK